MSTARDFTEEQNMFRDAYRRFLEAEIQPLMQRWREAGIVDREAFRKTGEQGFLMIWPDEQYGGTGDTDFRYEQIIIEETCRADCPEFFNTLHSRLVGPYISKLGTDEQKRRFLPGCVSGEKILAVAMTEPDAGSDLAGMRTTIKPDGGDWLLNGQKTYISNGINADYLIVAAKSDPENKPHAMTLAVVEAGMEGFERGRNLDKMGYKAQDTAELFFSNVRIPRGNILGEPHNGFYYLMQGLAEERLIGACQYASGMRVAFDLTREFAMQRKLFGKTLAEQQNTQFRMAEMDSEIEMFEIFIDHCVALHNRGELTAETAAKAKLNGSEIEWKMMDLGVQLHGGAGYMSEYRISRMFTDARIHRIWAGSSEVMKLIIGRHVFSGEYRSRFE